MPLVIAQTTLTVPIAILSETTLAFIGLGDPQQPSWGKMLEEAFNAGALAQGAWWYYVPPGVGVVLVVLAFTFIGRALEQSSIPGSSRSAYERGTGGALSAPLLAVEDLHVAYRSGRDRSRGARGPSSSSPARRSESPASLAAARRRSRARSCVCSRAEPR